MLGNDIETGEITVTIDDILVSHFAVSDLDEMLTHFEVRSKFAREAGRALARVFDKNVFRQMILAARTAADGPFPGGTAYADDALKATASVYDGAYWIQKIREANLDLYDLDVPEELPRYLAVNSRIFDAIKYAKDPDGNYLILDRDFGHGGAGGIQSRTQSIEIDGVTVLRTRNMPTVDESADNSVYAKYQADYSKTLGVLWTPMSVATVQMKGIGFETTRDTRRLEDFTVANMLVGHGTLRPECTIEFAAAT